MSTVEPRYHVYIDASTLIFALQSGVHTYCVMPGKLGAVSTMRPSSTNTPLPIVYACPGCGRA